MYLYISVSANRISVSAILVSVSVSTVLDIGYIGIGQNGNIGIGDRYVGTNISVSVLANISAGRMYRYRYPISVQP